MSNIFNDINQNFKEVSKIVKPLYYINPINEKDQKQGFLENRIKNPNFKYREIEYNSLNIEFLTTKLIMNLPNHPISEIYKKRIKNLNAQNSLIIFRGNQDIVRELSSEMYGKPDKNVVKIADDLLKKIPNKKTEKNIESSVIKVALERGLKDNGLNDWTVELVDKWLTTTYNASKKITVCKDRKFSSIDITRLPVHEIGVHVLRAVNGFNQDYAIFGLGLPGYLSTEEGLSVYFEEITNNLDPELIRNYAGRVVAVDSVCQDLLFRQTFDRLKSYNFSNDDAWNLTLRAHRGGGFIKDHVYLQGYSEVKEFAKNNDLKQLYVGKIGIKDLPLINKLKTQGIIKEPKYIPSFLE